MTSTFENYQNGGLPVPVDIEEYKTPDEKTRMVTLSTTAKGGEAYAKIFSELADKALELADRSHYVSMSASVLDDNPDEIEPECRQEHLVYTDETLKKVHRLIKDVLPHDTLDAHEVANDILLNMQGAGILFRERP